MDDAPSAVPAGAAPASSAAPVPPPATADATPTPTFADARALDLRRKLALLTIFNAVAAGFIFVLLLGVALSLMHSNGNLALTFAVLGVVAPALATLGIWLARKERATLSATALVAAILLATFAAQLAVISVAGIDTAQTLLFFAVYPLVIVIAGVLGDRRFIVITAAVALVLSFVVALALNTPYSGGIFIYALLQEAIATGVMVLFATGYRITLRDLAHTQQEYDRLVRIDGLKEQFITSVNHELRNPVMAMLGYIDLLQLPRNRADAERLALLVDEANRAGQDLRALLNSILETRRMDQGIEDFVPQPVNVRDALAAAMRLIDPREVQVAGREVRVRVPPNLYIMGDPVHLQQILTNLVSNALKYSSKDDPVDVLAVRVIDIEEQEGRWGRKTTTEREMIEIIVRDYGLGIPPADAPLLFQRFARLPRDLASKVIGNGLGLYLCRVLTEVMDGKIWLESTGIPGKGTTFYVRLPTAAAPGTLNATPSEESVESVTP